jgi:hypothetical protein
VYIDGRQLCAHEVGLRAELALEVAEVVLDLARDARLERLARLAEPRRVDFIMSGSIAEPSP